MSLADPPPSALADAVAALAALDDEAAAVDVVLPRIGRLARQFVAGCDAVSITWAGPDGPTTLAAHPELVRAVDEAQYAEQSGPCLQAIQGGRPVDASVEASITWPGFRKEALRLGLRRAVSVPLWTARGEPVAALNLWSRSRRALDPLGLALTAAFAAYDDRAQRPALSDPGAAELVAGVVHALELRAVVSRAVEDLVAATGVLPDEAFELLRADARSAGVDVVEVARRLSA